MISEKQKMLTGQLYDAADTLLVTERINARALLLQYNNCEPDKDVQRQTILKQLIPRQGERLFIQAPFYCDYGYNIYTGSNVYFNFNCVILDVMAVHIGNNVLFGPSVQIYTALHPTDAKQRAAGPEFAKSISIGSDVWVGGGVIICPGVTIGNRTIIGAGSVITRNIPDDVFAAGNPCRVIKNL